jgi:hypothetical protein
MLTLNAPVPRFCDRLNRREWLRIGGIGLGSLTLPALLQARARAQSPARGSFGRAKSVIVVWLGGGMPQHETFDHKLDAPEEIRGPFGAIDSATPGLKVGGLLPKISRLTDRLAVIRSMSTGDNAHSSSGYQMLTGVPHIPLSQENATPQRPNDSPSLNALVRALKQERGGLPPAITVPSRMANVGEVVWPGQDAGFLGKKHNPWVLTCDPADAKFTVPGCELPEELSQLRLDGRLSFLNQMNERLDQIDRNEAIRGYGRQSDQAIELLSGGKARQAFHLNQESDKTRDRYGRTKWGQSMLLARRLIEAGVSLVQVNWARIEGKPNGGGWDTHDKHNELLKDMLMPMLDQTYSALIEDLEQRGMLDETLVCLVSEFGHTPKFNARAGRDHWGKVFSLALAGGGVRGGVVHGATDRLSAEATTSIVKPCDYLATVYHCLGFEPDTIVYDQLNRPIPISRGKPVREVLG